MSFLDKILDGEVDEKAVSDMQQSLQQSLIQTDLFAGHGSAPAPAPGHTSHVTSHVTGPVSTVQSYITPPNQPVISRSNFSLMPTSIKAEPPSGYHGNPTVAPNAIKTEPPGSTRTGTMMTMLQPVHTNQPVRSLAGAPVLSTQTMLTQVQAVRSSPHTVPLATAGGPITSSTIVPTAVITPQRTLGPQVIAVSSSVMVPMAGGQFAVQSVSTSQPPQTITAQTIGGVPVRPNMIQQPIRALPNKPMVVPIQPLVQLPPNAIPTSQVKTQPIPIQPAVRHVAQPIQPPKSEQKTAAILSSMSTRESVQKLKAFLTNLLSISNKQDAATGQTVKDLIGKVMTNNIDEETFLNELQVALKSPPQPHLLVFLKQSVPVLRTEMQSRQRMTLMNKQTPQQQPVATHTPFPGLAPVQTSKMIPLTTNPNINQHFTTSTHYHPAPTFSAPQRTFADKYKKKYTLPKDSTEIIDVAHMAGVNLSEEAAKISTHTTHVSQEQRSTQDVTMVPVESLSVKINRICEKHGLRDCSAETKQLLSHAVEARMKNLMERLVVINHHRLDLHKDEDEVLPTSNVKGQLKMLEKIQLEASRRRAEREKAQLMREAKSRSKQSNSEAKAKAKQVAMAEEELIRQREANETALAAIGRKRPKFDFAEHGPLATPTNPRFRNHRINMKDVIFLCENDHYLLKTPLLFKLHVNPVK